MLPFGVTLDWLSVTKSKTRMHRKKEVAVAGQFLFLFLVVLGLTPLYSVSVVWECSFIFFVLDIHAR